MNINFTCLSTIRILTWGKRMEILSHIYQISSKPELTNKIFDIKNPINPQGHDLSSIEVSKGDHTYKIYMDINTNLEILQKTPILLNSFSRIGNLPHGMLFMFDLTDEYSFMILVEIINSLSRHPNFHYLVNLPNKLRGVFYLVGIITDVNKERVNESKILEMSKILHLTYSPLEVSSSSDFNDLYATIAEAAYLKNKNNL